ncbi:MAG: alpha/beta hydrolase [Hyphomicrobiales bacterium]|nr:MAG: alpha/beta hydrolase [Hyphomicrobiales bacterium]
MSEIIYRDFDRAGLDREYNARDSVPDFTIYLDQYAELSREARRNLACMCDLAYGDHPAMKLDYFPAGPQSPLFVYLHGGYWRALSAKESAFMARNFVENGISVAAVNYALAPEAGLDEIVRQCRAAIAYCADLAPELGLDAARIFAGGSSAGGHLAGMIAAQGWPEEMGAPHDVIKGIAAISGLYDLEPIRLSHVNEWMQLDAHSVRRNSPVNHLPAAHCKVVAGVGGDESSEFKRQSADYAARCRQAGLEVREVMPAGRNHFDVVMELGRPGSALEQAVFEMILG